MWVGVGPCGLCIMANCAELGVKIQSLLYKDGARRESDTQWLQQQEQCDMSPLDPLAQFPNGAPSFCSETFMNKQRSAVLWKTVTPFKD